MTKPIDRAVAKVELGRINAVLRKPHLLIGGLAVQQYHAARDTKDIDLVCEFGVARTLLEVLYPSRDWKVVDKQNDEYRPSFQITHKIEDLGVIIFGPKITEREPYAHIDWGALEIGAKPFRGRSQTLENILVPAPHALAYTKFISFLGRRAPVEKIRADLRDLVDLTNHEEFSVSLFFDQLRRSKAHEELSKDFQSKVQPHVAILEQSCLAGLASTFGLAGISAREASHGADVAPVAPPTVIRVASAEEFVSSIGSNRVLEIAPGVIDLSEAADRYLKHVRWDFEGDGRSVTIRDVENLTIKGSGLASTRLVVPTTYDYVLRFENARRTALSDLTLGHVPGERCSGGVLAATECRAIDLQRCALFGCGTEGLTLRGVVGFRMENCEVFDCTHGIATIESCQDAVFVSSTFRNNKEYHGFVIRDSQHVEFCESSVRSNLCTRELFDIVSSSDVRFVRGLIADNTCSGIGRIHIDGADVQRT